MREIVLIKLTT